MESLFVSSRRRFLKETFAFSALAALGSVPGVAAPRIADGTGEVNLFAIGDWGYDKQKEPQKAVAAALKKYALDKKVNAEAFLFLGDNWYGALEGGAQAERWQTEFEQMYPADVFNCPAYAILGNHDYQTWPGNKVEDELEYARLGKSRWTMPSRYYRFEFPKKKPLITFLALDTNVPHENGKGKSNGVDFTMTHEEYDTQLKWLEAELQKPRTTPYLVVLGHHPVYSNGQHGDTATLVRDWDPLLRKYKADFYFAGHDHDMQHIEFEGHPTSFFLSGGGGADLYDLKVDPAKRGPYAQKVYGFSHLSVTPKKFTLRHLDDKGQLVHAFTRTHEGKVEIL